MKHRLLPGDLVTSAIATSVWDRPANAAVRSSDDGHKVIDHLKKSVLSLVLTTHEETEELFVLTPAGCVGWVFRVGLTVLSR